MSYRVGSRSVKWLILTVALLSPIIFPAHETFATDIPRIPDQSVSHRISFVAFNNYASDPMGTLESVVVPLKRVGKLFLIEARVDDETGNFVFDTGSSRLVLNKTYFRNYRASESGVSGGVTGNTGAVGHIRIKRVDIANLGYDNLEADVTNLGHIENRRGVKILGLFGFSMLKNLEVVIDLNHSELRLFRIDKNGNRISASRRGKFDIIQKVEQLQDVLFVQAKIGGKVLDFCLDTGAESNVLNSFSSKKVLSTVSIQRRSSLVGAGATRVEVLYGVMNDFSFGETQIGEMQTIITSLESMSESYGVPIDGMLGYDFFCKGEVCINMVKKELGIWLVKKEAQ